MVWQKVKTVPSRGCIDNRLKLRMCEKVGGYRRYPATANKITKPRMLPDAKVSGADDFFVAFAIGLGDVAFRVRPPVPEAW